jgi:two-component system, NarL family, sensor histidine kinase UhpB
MTWLKIKTDLSVISCLIVFFGDILTGLSILHLEDNEADHELVGHVLRRSDLECELTWVETLEDFQQVLATRKVDAILADYHLGGFSGMDAWEWVKATGHDVPFIIVSGAIGEATVADAMVRGVSDYVDKNKLGRLPMVLQRALDFFATRRAQAAAARELAESRRRLVDLAEHLQTSIDRERADIAREIHDDIGGSLAAVKLDLAWIARRVTDEDTRQHVNAALAMAEHALGASQRIMRNLRPSVLDQGLVPAVQWLAQTFAERTGMAVKWKGALTAPLPKDVEMVAYRTAQEAMTNVLKHAQATELRIELSDLEGFLTLEISDNGHGATAQDLAKLKSFGLLGLKERAQTVGGWLDVVTGAGAGLTLILSVPLDGARGGTEDEMENPA